MRPRHRAVPGAFAYLVTGTCSPLCVCASGFYWLLTVCRVVAVQWGVGQLADRPAVNREVGGSSPPAPALQVQARPSSGLGVGILDSDLRGLVETRVVFNRSSSWSATPLFLSRLSSSAQCVWRSCTPA